MKISGLNLTIVRSETTNITFNITNEIGQPFVLLAEDMYEKLNFRFRVKKDPFSIVTKDYVINKVFDMSAFHRFDSAVIINLKEFTLEQSGNYEYNDNYWPIITNDYPNQLFYHPGLKSYAYYEDDAWHDYSIDITVPFISSDTEELDYGDYYYDAVIEAGNHSGIEYTLVVIPQHAFTIDYRT